MIFNGLSKSDLVVYNALADMLNGKPRPISAGQVACKTGYSNKTVRVALARLVDWELVDRTPTGPGQPYEYDLVKE